MCNLLIRFERRKGGAELYAPRHEQGWLENGRITPAVAVVNCGYPSVFMTKNKKSSVRSGWGYTNAGYTNVFV